MKESRFIELLNLYVDHQLSPAEAAELESEILRNPARRQTYQQYCRMQKACTMLFERESTHAPASGALATALVEADRKIVEFPKSHLHWTRALYPIAAAAAAACIAIVVVRRDQSHGVTPVSAPVVASTVPQSTAAEQSVSIDLTAAKVAPANSRPEYFSVFATRRSSADRQVQPVDTLTTSVPRDGLGSYAWMRDVELAPVPTLVAEQITLKNSNGTQPEDRILRSSKPVRGVSDELSAFQFQR
ncbi:hypothetical protein DB347_23670 [Opitutaceae bacterium EW11]|nr:hypothetical protein DB347_23670 [Opitutaceae bacterium EW11]